MLSELYNYMSPGIALTGIVAYRVLSQAVMTEMAFAAKWAGGAAIAAEARHVPVLLFGAAMFMSPL